MALLLSSLKTFNACLFCKWENFVLEFPPVLLYVQHHYSTGRPSELACLVLAVCAREEGQKGGSGA